MLSRARRDAGDRQSGASGLLRLIDADETYLRRERVPEHAASEADRLLARSDEYRATPRATSAVVCWHDWNSRDLTPHDGLVRQNHPVIRRALEGPLSATGLQRLVGDPLGYVWRYAFGWDAPAEEDEPIVLDPLSFGILAHSVLELAVIALEQMGGFAAVDAGVLARVIESAAQEAADKHAEENPIPPRLVWTHTLAVARALAETALIWPEEALPGQRSYAEVPFGKDAQDSDPDRRLPWNPASEVRVPGTEITITGRIDRLDLAADDTAARVTDYKTGKVPAGALGLRGGAELQRVLYAFAVNALLGENVEIASRLLYPRDGGHLFDLAEPRTVLAEVATYLEAARNHLLTGNAVIGNRSGEYETDPLTFALPGHAKDIYFETKRPAANRRLAPLPTLWDMA